MYGNGQSKDENSHVNALTLHGKDCRCSSAQEDEFNEMGYSRACIYGTLDKSHGAPKAGDG